MGGCAVETARDGWDWASYWVSFVATATALVAFGYWILEQRRRPEARFSWWFSPDVDPANLTPWEGDEVFEIRPGQSVLVQAAILNVGDRAGTDRMSNFVAPACLKLRRRARPEQQPLTAENHIAGRELDPRVVFFAEGEPWSPGNWVSLFFELTYPTENSFADPHPIRLLFDVADSRFNATGRRRLPSLVADETSAMTFAPAGSSWPPTAERHRRRVKWINAQPRARVVCGPGVRRDVRDLELMPLGSKETAKSQVKDDD